MTFFTSLFLTSLSSYKKQKEKKLGPILLKPYQIILYNLPNTDYTSLQYDIVKPTKLYQSDLIISNNIITKGIISLFLILSLQVSGSKNSTKLPS